MNHDTAREVQKDGKGTGLWHYTTSNDRGGTHAIGNCSPWDSCGCGEQPHGWPADPNCPKCNGTGLVPKVNPCPGHATPEAACEHQKQYVLDRVTFSGPKLREWPKHKCAVPTCNEEATMLAIVEGRHDDKPEGAFYMKGGIDTVKAE